MSLSEKEMDEFITGTMDFDLANALMKKNNQSHKKETNGLNEFGDKIGKTEVCQGVLLFLGAVSLLSLLSVRGCHEIKKHQDKNIEKARVFQVHDAR